MGTEEGEQKGKEKEKRNDEPRHIYKKKKKKSDKFKDSKYKDLTLKLSLTMSNSFCTENRILAIIKVDFAFLDFGQFKSKIRLT